MAQMSAGNNVLDSQEPRVDRMNGKMPPNMQEAVRQFTAQNGAHDVSFNEGAGDDVKAGKEAKLQLQM